MNVREIYMFKSIEDAYKEFEECLELLRAKTGEYDYHPPAVFIFDTGRGYFPSVISDEFPEYKIASVYMEI